MVLRFCCFLVGVGWVVELGRLIGVSVELWLLVCGLIIGVVLVGVLGVMFDGVIIWLVLWNVFIIDCDSMWYLFLFIVDIVYIIMKNVSSRVIRLLYGMV